MNPKSALIIPFFILIVSVVIYVILMGGKPQSGQKLPPPIPRSTHQENLNKTYQNHKLTLNEEDIELTPKEVKEQLKKAEIAVHYLENLKNELGELKNISAFEKARANIEKIAVEINTKFEEMKNDVKKYEEGNDVKF